MLCNRIPSSQVADRKIQKSFRLRREFNRNSADLSKQTFFSSLTLLKKKSLCPVIKRRRIAHEYWLKGISMKKKTREKVKRKLEGRQSQLQWYIESMIDEGHRFAWLRKHPPSPQLAFACIDAQAEFAWGIVLQS